MTTIQKQQLNNREIRMCFQGDLDAAAIEYLKGEFELLAKSTCNVHLDFTYVPFIDSSGIGALVFLFKRMRIENRQLHIIGCQGQPLKLFKHLRVDHTIDINQSLSTSKAADK
ncbi:MAG: STAS domain-containing protein [Oceanospirillaceae bacterium]|nr:STAS domain-containing protein [Oceanospirillaceae bacterium]